MIDDGSCKIQYLSVYVKRNNLAKRLGNKTRAIAWPNEHVAQRCPTFEISDHQSTCRAMNITATQSCSYVQRYCSPPPPLPGGFTICNASYSERQLFVSVGFHDNGPGSSVSWSTCAQRGRHVYMAGESPGSPLLPPSARPPLSLPLPCTSECQEVMLDVLFVPHRHRRTFSSVFTPKSQICRGIRHCSWRL